jgi:streptogramin lyase
VRAAQVPNALADRLVKTELTVTVTNSSSSSFAVSPSDFALCAQGDMFGVLGPSGRSGPVWWIEPGHSKVIRLTFSASNVEGAALVYRPRGLPIAEVSLNVSPSRRRARAAASAHRLKTFRLTGGVGEPWGTAVDRRGNIWFAEPGCDFEPTCPAGTPPGQIGELKASSHTVVLHTLPDIPGNQPIFLAFDRSGNLWFTTPDNSKIGEYRPGTGRFVGQWAVTPGSGPWDLTFYNRKIWYTEHLVSAVGVFSPSSHRHRDFRTPSANSNPYGIAADGGLIWFTENNSRVDRVAVLQANRRGKRISEYPIVRPLSGTPHMLVIGRNGHPWWTEGWSNTIATLNPARARPGRCGTRSGACRGVHRFALPPSTRCSQTAHASGIGFEHPRRVVWIDNSLTAQVGSFNVRSRRFSMRTLSNCNAHPHDGLKLGPRRRVWFDEEFENAIGELIQ